MPAYTYTYAVLLCIYQADLCHFFWEEQQDLMLCHNRSFSAMQGRLVQATKDLVTQRLALTSQLQVCSDTPFP